MFENLPKTLKKEGRFCAWKYEVRNGRKTKVPYRTDGARARNTVSSDFSTYDEALAVYAKGGYDGIGVLIEGKISAIDVDDCIVDGKLTPLAEDIVRMADSYTEKSPSGNGIRILLNSEAIPYDRQRYYINNKAIHVEVYAAGYVSAFVTVTGNRLCGSDLEKRGQQMLSIAETYMVRPAVMPVSDVEAPGSCLADEEVIYKASHAANAEKFLRLWNGDTSGYTSQSEADLALATILAFYCGGDSEQMDRLFRQSGLYRDKWDRADYCEHTLEKAVRGCREFYHPVSVSTPDEDFGDGIKTAFSEPPIPLDGMKVPEFPVDALPADVRDYVLAVSESTQTPVDLPAVAALAVLAIGAQGKYVIRPKPDWKEPLNLYVAAFMPPSERKSAVCSAMARPLNDYEREWNSVHAAEVDYSKTQRNVLERRLRSLEEQVSKGKAEMADVRKASEKLTAFRDVKPLRYYCDDITTEKLVCVIDENGGIAAIFSSEGGIFDLLRGIYAPNVNIDVYLKAYSGDSLRVDRVGRESKTIYNPALTVMLMAQPSVLAGVLENDNFRGRGLTARFLYCMPESNIGSRRYRTVPVPEKVYRRYEQCIRNLLTDEPDNAPEVITLSPEADAMLGAFSEEVEPKLKTEYADISDWAGKLVGSVARIAGLLCRAEKQVYREFLSEPQPLVVSGAVMANAIRIGRYFAEHAKAAFSLLGADSGIRNCKYVLAAIEKSGLIECNRRDIMRLCRSFKTKDEIQPVLDQLVEYGYLAEKDRDDHSGRGRTPTAMYLVNPCIYGKS